jgi:hypothetical protein
MSVCSKSLAAKQKSLINWNYHLSYQMYIFHMSQLKKKYLQVPEEQLSMGELDLGGDFTNTEKPIKILDTAERVTHNKIIKMCKVQWSHHTEDEATWEHKEELRAEYPESFPSAYESRG